MNVHLYVTMKEIKRRIMGGVYNIRMSVPGRGRVERDIPLVAIRFLTRSEKVDITSHWWRR